MTTTADTHSLDTPLGKGLWFVEDLNAQEFARLAKLNEEGGQIIAEVFNALHVLWTAFLSTEEPEDLDLTARTVADLGYRLREQALALGLLAPRTVNGRQVSGESYMEAGPVLEQAGHAIASCRSFLEHYRGPGAWSYPAATGGRGGAS